MKWKEGLIIEAGCWEDRREVLDHCFSLCMFEIFHNKNAPPTKKYKVLMWSFVTFFNVLRGRILCGKMLTN